MPVDPEKLRVWQLTDAAWYPVNKAVVVDESVSERRCCLLVCAKVTDDELWIVGDHPFVNLTISSDEPAPTLAWNHFDDDVHQKILDEVAKVAHDASHENWQGFEGLRALAFRRPPSLPSPAALTEFLVGQRVRVRPLWVSSARGPCEGRVLGHSITGSDGVVWVPVRWEGHDDPNWFKARGLELVSEPAAT